MSSMASYRLSLAYIPLLVSIFSAKHEFYFNCKGIQLQVNADLRALVKYFFPTSASEISH